MTQEEVKEKLLDLGFSYVRNEEYNHDEYTSMYKNTKVEIFVGYHILTFVWWYRENRKFAKHFLLKYMTEPLDEKFVECVVKDLTKHIQYGLS